MISGDAIALKDSHQCEHHHDEHEPMHPAHGSKGKCEMGEFFGGSNPALLEEYDQNKDVITILSNIVTTPNSNDSKQFFH